MTKMYDVGGVMYPRPFKPTRLGHMGLWRPDPASCLDVYANLLGLRHTDDVRNPAGEVMGVFTTCNTDHHAMVALSPVTADPVRRKFYDENGVTLNQMSFQVNSLKEVHDACQFFEDRGVTISRVGRDEPGSNWAVYVFDPDGHRVEFFYGMEQIGWSGKSKPSAMYGRLPRKELFTVPRRGEEEEVHEARSQGIDLESGFGGPLPLPYAYEVGGIMMQRPFRIGRIGPVRLFVADVAASEKFYTEIAGLYKTEELMYGEHRCVFLRAGAEHHSLALFPLALREELQMSPATTLMSLGMEVQSYAQLRDAVSYLRQHGLKQIELPAQLHPGIEFAAHFMLDELHCLQLYFQMEQLGWDARPRPASERRSNEPWPERLTGDANSYLAQTRQGPLA